jgi:hypothetical protein
MSKSSDRHNDWMVMNKSGADCWSVSVVVVATQLPSSWWEWYIHVVRWGAREGETEWLVTVLSGYLPVVWIMEDGMKIERWDLTPDFINSFISLWMMSFGCLIILATFMRGRDGTWSFNDERFAKCCCVPTVRDDVGTSSQWCAHWPQIRRKFLQGIVDSRLVWRALLVGMWVPARYLSQFLCLCIYHIVAGIFP